MRQTRDELETTTSELERQRVLNERLENDLLQLNKHEQQNGDANGVDKPSDATSDDELLAGLDLRKKPSKSGAGSVSHGGIEVLSCRNEWLTDHRCR